MITVLMAITIIFLLFALFISLMEQRSGFIGDSSTVPGIMIVMFIALSVIVAIGFYNGLITIQ